MLSTMAQDIPSDDIDLLRDAKRRLEHPGLAVRVTDLIGSPIERGMQMLPPGTRQTVDLAAHKALESALHFAVSTLDPTRTAPPSNLFHKVAVTAIGAGGGAFGLTALPVELPASTTLMMRSIADVARAHGEDITRLEARLACLEVFALGGASRSDDAADAGYFAVRAALAGAVTDAARHIASEGLSKEAAPAVVRLIALLARRFGVAVSEKVAAQLVPLVGAAGGAAINLLFMEHYQSMAAGHFTVRKLERKHTPEQVREAYDGLRT